MDGSQQPSHAADWLQYLQERRQNLNSEELVVEGRLTRIVGLTLEATGCQAAIGSRCLIETDKLHAVEAEVIGFFDNKTYLMPIGDMAGLLPGAKVTPSEAEYKIPLGDDLLGRILDGRGRPLDGKSDFHHQAHRSLIGKIINPLDRTPIREKLDVGIRSINALLSVGVGQRMGLFAGSGVGKSVLLGMMTKYSSADVIVVGLIGERGREVNEFVQEILGAEGMRRAVVVAVPADNPPLLRLHGAMLATTIAEYFRDQGREVLLLMDSLTRFAQAQREIALAVGEPPATKGYPPSVFTKLPQLVERAGTGKQGQGSITAFYTVLAEGDDHNDPIADAARAILDGHIVLSRDMAEAGIYPAISIDASVSRLMSSVVDDAHQLNARLFRRIYAKYLENKEMIAMGIYQDGSDADIDDAIQKYPLMRQFLQQDMHESVSMSESLAALNKLLN